MSLSVKRRIRVEKDAVVRIYRSLKGSGVINVSKNQEVGPIDILGTAQVSPGFRILNLAVMLGVPPADAQKYLKRPLGQRIYKGELLAYKKGWLFGDKKIVTSPTDGVLDSLNPKSGELKMTFLPKKMDLPAGVYGIVEGIDNEKGLVVIRTRATVIRAIAGSGRTRDGILHIIGRRDELVGKDFISQKNEEEILVGGSLIFKEAITASIAFGVKGIITGGINAKDYKSMAGGRLVFPKKLENDIGISVLVCEGFGSIPIGEDIYEILKAYDGRFVSIDGNGGAIFLPSFESKSINKVRNAILPPIRDNAASLYQPDLEIRPNLRVRVVGNYFPGAQGKVLAIDRTETVLASGVKTFMVTIATSTRKIQVPVANIECID